MLEITEWASDLLARSRDAARRFQPGVVIRVVPRAGGIEAKLAEAPEHDDEPSPIEGVYLAPGLDGMIDAQEPHSELVLRPAGSTPNERAHD